MGLLGFAIAMAATPGPNNMMAAASGATYGMGRSLPLSAGIATGVAAIMLVVAAFGSAVVTDPRIGAMLKWIGVLYLLWLAWKVGNAEPVVHEEETTKPARDGSPLSFLDGALFQLVNPKLWVMVSGAVVTYGQGANAGRMNLAFLFATVFGMATFISVLGWTALGASIGRLLSSRRSIRVFNIAMAALLIVSLIPIVIE
ncbi:LysE family translocator [Brucella sp. IR073]|uniref:LysE family translocator n=1 Tax=unclassified Brucella TaxID=2632610 RepID=UPI003B97E64B